MIPNKTPASSKAPTPQTPAVKANSTKPDTFNTLAWIGIGATVAFVGISKVSEAVAESDWYVNTFNTISAPEPRCELATNGKAARAAVYAKDSDGHERLEQTSGTLRNEAGQVPVPGLKGVFMSKDVNTAYSASITNDNDSVFSFLVPPKHEIMPYAVQDMHTQVTITGWNGESPIGSCAYINTKGHAVGDVWKGMPLERSGLNYF